MMDDRSLGERVADTVAKFGGSWRFISIFSIFLAGWIVFNSLVFFKTIAFDPAPFILLNLILSFIAAFQAPFIMMSQNRTEKKQDVAYRHIFREIKDLVMQDLETEVEIHTLEKEIKSSLEVMVAQQARLLSQLQKALALAELNRQDIAEILQRDDHGDGC